MTADIAIVRDRIKFNKLSLKTPNPPHNTQEATTKNNLQNKQIIDNIEAEMKTYTK